MRSIPTITSSLALAAATTVALAPGAVAKGGGDGARRAAGDCTGASTATLKVKPDDGLLETEFEVDQNRAGVAWRVVLRRDGRTVARTTATTRAPSGSFSVERRLRDAAGRNVVTARATSPSGEVCTARVRV